MKYILLKRSFASGKGNHMTFSRCWSLEVKAKQRIEGVEFSTKQKLDTEVSMAIEEIATISEEKGLSQEFRQKLQKICADEFAKFINKPNFTNIKRLIKNVLSKVEKAGIMNRTIESKLYRTKLAMRNLNN